MIALILVLVTIIIVATIWGVVVCVRVVAHMQAEEHLEEIRSHRPGHVINNWDWSNAPGRDDDR